MNNQAVKHNSLSNRNHRSNRGEIALILTLTSLISIIIGLVIGTHKSYEIKQASLAQENCSYNATAVVVKDNKNGALLSSAENQIIPWGVSNDKQSQSVPAKQFGVTASTNYYANPFTFGDYKDHDKASVTLIGLNSNKYTVTGVFCEPLSPNAKGCDYGIATTGTRLKIDNFHITCGVDIRYGWIIEPISTTPTPTTSREPTGTTAPTITRTPIATNFPTPSGSQPSVTPNQTKCKADVHFVVDSSRSVIDQFSTIMSRLGSILRNYKTNNPNADITFSLQYFSTHLEPNQSIGSVSTGIRSPFPRPRDQSGTNIKEALSDGLISESTNVFVSDGVPTVVKYTENGTNATCAYSTDIFSQPNFMDLTPDLCVLEGTRITQPIFLCSPEVQQICGNKSYRQANRDSKSGIADFSVLVRTGDDDANFIRSVGKEMIDIDDLTEKFDSILDASCEKEIPTSTPTPTTTSLCTYYAESFVRECLQQDSSGTCTNSRAIADYDLNTGNSIVNGDYGTANNKQQRAFGDRPMVVHPFPSFNTKVDRSIPGEIHIGDRNADITTQFIGGIGDNSDNTGYLKTGEYANPIKVYLNKIDRNGVPDFDWKIVGQSCQSFTLDDGCGPNNVKSFNIPAPSNNPELLNNVKVQCGTDVRYGWYVVKNSDKITNADFNNDKVVNTLDLAICLNQWGQSDRLTPELRTCDINNDKHVNSSDFSYVFGVWIKTQIQ